NNLSRRPARSLTAPTLDFDSRRGASSKTPVKRLSSRGHLLQQLVRLKALAVLVRQFFAAQQEIGSPNGVVHGDRSTVIRSKPPPQNGADVGISRFRDHALYETAGGIQGLDGQHPGLQLVAFTVGLPFALPVVKKAGPQPRPLAVRAILIK